MKVFVLDTNKTQLMPCSNARARELLKKHKASIYKRYPFTIILNYAIESNNQNIVLKIDPGSKKTGISLVAEYDKRREVIFGANLEHRGNLVKKNIEQRRNCRRGRRNRKTRYRKPRFLNRAIPKGWLPPSFLSRLNNVFNVSNKLRKYVNVTTIEVETTRFDTQKMDNKNISGVEYQQGTLFGYEVREYLLEKFKHKCIYCGVTDIPLEIEHIIPKSKGGSNRIDNLGISCRKCNQQKGNLSLEEFGKKKKKDFSNIKKQLKSSLKDSAYMNSSRYKIGKVLKSFGMSVSFWSGGRTKYNRTKQGYKKDHWVDASCVGDKGDNVYIPKDFIYMEIKANGRGNRQMCKVDKYGFPRSKAKGCKTYKGFQTGDFVKAVYSKGKYKGIWYGKVTIRNTGQFDITKGKLRTSSTSYKNFKVIQKYDGYLYTLNKS